MLKEFNQTGSLHLNESLLHTGGAEGYILDLAKSFQKQNISICLATGQSENLELPKISYLIPGIQERQSRQDLDTNVGLIKQIMEDNNLNIVHLHSIDNPELYSELSTTFPIIRTIHDSRVVCPTEFRIDNNQNLCATSIGSNCLNCSENKISIDQFNNSKESLESLETLDLLITPSNYIKNQLVINGISENKIEVLPLFAPLDLNPQPIVDINHASDILFIGRIIKSKGLREAISSLSKIDHEYNLVVCGDGPDLDICRSMATDLGVSDRIKFVGWTNKKEKEMYLAGTKVVVFPSMGPESFGLVGLEAMFYQKPVVAFNSGGINQWLENGENGFLIERGNTDQMAEYLNKILVSKSLRNEMGTKGRIILDTEFSLEKHISGLMEIYSRVKRQKY